MLLSPQEFFHWKYPRKVVDIRPANSFIKGSFPGAISLASERFKSHIDLISALKDISSESPVHIIDLDGKHTKEIVKELPLYGLKGGYKQFRIWRDSVFSNECVLAVLGGKTGSGKTEALDVLRKMDHQVIDLEKIAVHRGSAFGSFTGKAQPKFEDFQNKLLEVWLSFDSDKPIWIEEKGEYLGKVGLPTSLYQKMLKSFMVELDVPFEERLHHILGEYGTLDQKTFIEYLRKVQNRMGESAYHRVLHYYKLGQTEKSFQLLLEYYDRTYDKRRELYQPVGAMRIQPDILRNADAVNRIEKEIMNCYKVKVPAQS